MLLSLAHRKTLLASLTALVLMITFIPALSTHSLPLSFAPNMANNTISGISRNWAGYEARGGFFTSITGTWTVPQVSSNGFAAIDGTWIGIGGIVSSDLIQSGTSDVVSGSGQVVYSAFFELLPYAPQSIPVTIQSGDSITVTITEQQVNQWQISFTDTTTGQTCNITTSHTSSCSSAEWIEEAPNNRGRILPLDNFGTVVFSGGYTVENGYQVTIAQSNAQPTIMVNSIGQPLATPSLLGSDGASFSITRTTAISNVF